MLHWLKHYLVFASQLCKVCVDTTFAVAKLSMSARFLAVNVLLHGCTDAESMGLVNEFDW